MLSSSSFTASHFTFRFMIHLSEFYEGHTVCVEFFFFIWTSSCSSNICWKGYLFSVVLLFLFCQRSSAYIYVGLFLGLLFCPIHLSILSSVPWCLDYCSFIIILKLSGISPPTLFSFNIMLTVLGLLALHINIRISLLISTE